MKLYEANKILRSVKTALATDGIKVPQNAETDGLMMLLGKIDADKYLVPKIKHAASAAPGSATYERLYGHIIFFRALQAVKHEAIADPVTSMSVVLLHRLLFGDFDVEAGKTRTTEVFTDGNAHTDPKYIPGSLKSIISKMNEIQGSPQLAKADFAGYLSHYMRELIILHPFERGSQLTVRIFLMLFCGLKGFGLGYHRITHAAVRAAEATAIATDDVAALYKLLMQCLMYETRDVGTQRKVHTRRELSNEQLSGKSGRRLRIDEQPDKPPKPPAKQKTPADDDVLKRAVRLQQKITKLNEQLIELMQPLEDDD